MIQSVLLIGKKKKIIFNETNLKSILFYFKSNLSLNNKNKNPSAETDLPQSLNFLLLYFFTIFNSSFSSLIKLRKIFHILNTHALRFTVI